MKFTAEKASLTKALTTVARIIERRNTIPILGNILLEANGPELVIIGTDLDLEMHLATEISCQIGGTTTVPAALLSEIARKLQGDIVNFEFNAEAESLMTVGAGRSKFKLQCLPSQDFPSLTVGNYSHQFSLKSADLRKLISNTMFAMSTEETRYYLNGVFLHVLSENGDDMLRAVATDGHRLALSNIDAPREALGMPGIIIPRKSIGHLKDLLDLAETVDVSISDNKARFQVGSATMTTKLIDGTFPDYQRVIPKNGNKVAVLNSKIVAAASDRVSTVSSGKGNAVTLLFEDNKLTLSVNSPDNGSADDEVEVQYDGDAIKIGFNNKYLQDVFDHIESKTARITLDDPGSPALIRDEEGGRSLFVLMPMRV